MNCNSQNGNCSFQLVANKHSTIANGNIGDRVGNHCNCTYVDDIITGVDTEEAAFNLYVQSKDMFRRNGFNLRRFISISRELKQIDCTGAPPPQEWRRWGVVCTGYTWDHSNHECQHKVLRVPWNPTSDCLIFDVAEVARLANSLQLTKRNIVSLTGKFYDHLRFLAPVTIKFKVLFQKLCRDKLEWDMKSWSRSAMTCWMISGKEVQFDSQKLPPPCQWIPTSVTLCGFCDALTHA